MSGFLLYSPAFGNVQNPATPDQPEKRTALVIGNGSYTSGPLRNPLNDARSMAKTLKDLSFDVALRENLDQKDMKREIQAFGQKLQGGGVGLFYFAGHGVQVNGHNYLIPVGASIEHEKQVEYEAVDMGAVLSEMDYARNRLNLVILDACRDNPFARSFRSASQGLASINAPSGTLIAFATAPGSVANDGPGDNGVYTGELVKAMMQPGIKIEDIFKQVRSAVREGTRGKQVPWESSSLEGDFYFKAQPVKTPPTTQAPSSPAQAGPASGAADRSASSGQPAEPASRGEKPLKAVKTWKEPVTGLDFVWVQGGCYLMGSPTSEKKRGGDEGPVHEVCVDGFWMSRTEVTNGQFRKFQPDHDSKNYSGHSMNGDQQPTVYVSWWDANNFAQWLTGQNGSQYNFRLPTEAEWEYAARAGSDASHYWGEDLTKACVYENVADYTAQKQLGTASVFECDDGYAGTAQVRTFQPNAFGLYDMLGNVAEWCSDVYSVDAYVKHDRSNPQFT
ncbi:MAG: SUMF1/EgtB/PvdO family nonheme iron enzyme, partial [Desulfobacteraceae bacterium]|nr:SUMF1/EgtB/PvdO family nonheme iron enzyme [Desulfobacteraceae bacterium]